MNTKQLKPDPRNPRKISNEKLELLKKSLKQFGDLSSIIFNKRTGFLISGHQRLKAIPEEAEIIIEKTYAMPTASGTVAEGYIKLGTESLRYREVDVDQITQTAMNIAANKHSAEWDISILNEHLLDLDAVNFDMDLTGFTHGELENFIAPITPPKSEPEEGPKEKCPHCGK